MRGCERGQPLREPLELPLDRLVIHAPKLGRQRQGELRVRGLDVRVVTEAAHAVQLSCSSLSD